MLFASSVRRQAADACSQSRLEPPSSLSEAAAPLVLAGPRGDSTERALRDKARPQRPPGPVPVASKYVIARPDPGGRIVRLSSETDPAERGRVDLPLPRFDAEHVA